MLQIGTKWLPTETTFNYLLFSAFGFRNPCNPHSNTLLWFSLSFFLESSLESSIHIERKRGFELTMAFAGTTQKCMACDKTVYLVDKLTADNRVYHKACFRCHHCKGTLKVFLLCFLFSLYLSLGFSGSFYSFQVQFLRVQAYPVWNLFRFLEFWLMVLCYRFTSVSWTKHNFLCYILGDYILEFSPTFFV